MQIKKTHLVLCSIVVLAALFLGLYTVNKCVRQLRADEQAQLEQNILDAARQNAQQLEAAIDLRIKFLASLSSQMADETDREFIVDEFEPLLKIYSAERIGYAGPDGDAYLSGGVRADISDREFFRWSINGSPFISEELLDSQGRRVFVHSFPVLSVNRPEQVTGVMFVVYDAAVFTDILRVGAYEGRGNSWILSSDGSVVAVFNSGRLEPGMNMFDDLMVSDPSFNAEAVDSLRQAIAAGDSGSFANISDGSQRYFINLTEIANKPGSGRWFLATAISEDVLGERVYPLLNGVRRVLLVLILLMLACGVVFVLTYRRHQKQLYELAYICPLTRIDNYSAFKDKMRSGAASGPGYVITVNLRGFNTINNAFGVAKGDQLLYAMGTVLKGAAGSGELAAHVSCDSFVLFLHAPSDDALIRRLRLIRGEIMDLSPLLDLPQLVPQFGVCGVDSTDNPEQGYGNALLAMNWLRDRVDYFYYFFDDAIRAQTLEAHELEGEFAQALAERQFEMWYQPKYSPTDGALVAAEALVRWRRPDGTLVSPGRFIPLFEKNGMITHLDEYTFDAVCAQQRAWMNDGLSVVPVSVNISRVSLYFPNITGRYMVVMNRHGISTDNVELEITEGAIENNVDVENKISLFHSCGFRIQVDDFGSGYSSLSTLTKKYFDTIKIDKSLVDCIGAPEGESLLESIVQLAHKFNMTVTAEGVEDARQRDFLITHDCDNIQGYYYSKPLPAAEFEALLHKRAS